MSRDDQARRSRAEITKVARRLKVVESLPREDGPALSRYQTVFDQSSDSIMTLTSGGKIDDINHAGEELAGYSKDELLGHSFDILAPVPGRHVLPPHARLVNHEMLLNPGMYEDVAIQRKDGHLRFVDFTVRPAEHEGERFTMVFFRDVSAKKSLEREVITKHIELLDACRQLEKKTAEIQAMQELLVQSGKLAALGELAAGIAHELNQPLQAIKGYAQEMQQVGVSKQGLQEIVTGADKMATIISHLRVFVRKSTEEFEMTSVHNAIDDAFKMLSRQLASHGIAIEKNFAAQLPDVYANPLQLEQVFINLATNARDAIDATGRGKGTIRVSTRVNGAMVEIRFKDNGTGMNEKTRSKVFNPFFTTKEVGKGMGLGMSLCYGFLSKIHGSIVLESEMGKGTEFVIQIPKDFRELT